MSHRDRVVAAVGRYLARAGAKSSPVNALVPWVGVAGCALSCARCETRSRAPLPRDVHTYNQAVKAFMARHLDCQAEREEARP